MKRFACLVAAIGLVLGATAVAMSSTQAVEAPARGPLETATVSVDDPCEDSLASCLNL